MRRRVPSTSLIDDAQQRLLCRGDTRVHALHLGYHSHNLLTLARLHGNVSRHLHCACKVSGGIPARGLEYPRVFVKPVPVPIKTHTLGHGYGFSGVQVQVALENPRVTRANP